MGLKLLATAAFGLEAVVVRELQALGYTARVEQPGRVAFSGDDAAIAQANIWLRSAERVLLVVAEFQATDFGQLFDGVAAADWGAWAPADGAFPVRGRSHKSKLSSVPACQRIVKKAIADRLLSQHAAASLPETGPVFPVEVALLNDFATLTLDTTGPGLHKRGYRPQAGPAPLRETLAAGILQLSYWRPGRPWLDPFCGAGTLAIEAALLGRRVAPGLRRAFIAETWPTLPAQTWRRTREHAEALILPPLEERLIATDADADSLRIARVAAAAAGVERDIHFQQRAFAETLSRREHGCLFANPPYGQRLGDRRRLAPLYESFPLVLRRLKTWSHYLITAFPDFERVVGQPASRRRKLYNGRIACTLYTYRGPKPPGPGEPREAAEGASEAPPPTPAFGGLRGEAPRQFEEFKNRLRKNARHLRRWPERRGVTCFRVYDRDIPEAPLAVDRYEDESGRLWLHLAEYDRPHTRTPAQHADWLDGLARVAAGELGASREQVFLKHRARQRGASQYQKLGRRGVTTVVVEAGRRLRVNLSDYLDTGLFLDHRNARGMVGESSSGRRVLNLFAYTGAFSVYAATGGAAHVTTVDLSATYLDWAAENFALNGVHPGDLIRADARDYVASLPRRPLFDLAIVDPPTFSNSKRTGVDWDVQRDAAPLLLEIAHRLSPGARLLFSTNSRRFKLDEQPLAGVFETREISRQTVPEDFRNKRIHRCWSMLRL